LAKVHRFSVHATFRICALQKYALSGVRLSSAVFGPPFIKTGIAHAMLST